MATISIEESIRRVFPGYVKAREGINHEMVSPIFDDGLVFVPEIEIQDVYGEADFDDEMQSTTAPTTIDVRLRIMVQGRLVDKDGEEAIE